MGGIGANKPVYNNQTVNSKTTKAETVKETKTNTETKSNFSSDDLKIGKNSATNTQANINFVDSQPKKPVTLDDLNTLKTAVNELSKAVVILSANALTNIDEINPKDPNSIRNHLTKAVKSVEDGKKGVKEQKILTGIVEEFADENKGTKIGDSAKKISEEMTTVTDKSVKDINTAIETLRIAISYLDKQ